MVVLMLVKEQGARGACTIAIYFYGMVSRGRTLVTR